MRRLAVVVVVLCLVTGVAHGGDLYKDAAGPHAVDEFLGAWRDPARDRVIPYKVYAPRAVAVAVAVPVVVVSHGVGGSREGLSYLGRHWASHGYLAVHLQHAGSDEEVLRGLAGAAAMRALQKAAADPRAAADRPLDVRFAVDRILADGVGHGAFAYRADPGRLAVAGHSFGAFTALAAAGVTFATPRGKLNLGDPRLKAAIALSAPAMRNQTAESFATVAIPTLHMTGTDDDGVVTDTDVSERRNAYDRITAAPRHLVVLDGADHMTFGGRTTDGAGDERHLALIRATTTAFLDAYVLHDAVAVTWLVEGLVAGDDGIAVVEHR